MENDMKKAISQMLVLYLLMQREHYISELAERIQEESAGNVRINRPYNCLTLLQSKGFVICTGRKRSPDGRLRRYYAITANGASVYKEMLTTYRSYMVGIAHIMAKEA